MEKVQNKPEIKKTQVFNVIILDRSGSMCSIREAAVQGFNETLAGIKKAQEKFADTQDHFVTLVTFCSCETKHVFDKTPAADAQPLKLDDFQPCCTTPLYDAMGITLTAMHKHVKEIEDSVVVATIITDGMENASREYSGKAIKELVERLRGEGWTFTYMGANQDAVEVASELSIRNSRNFAYSHKGTCDSMAKDSSTRMNFFNRLSTLKHREAEDGVSMSANERYVMYASMADEAFDEEEGKK
ncbi:MAG: VWA domain-containing protein [Bacteroidaceae bacterium]